MSETTATVVVGGHVLAVGGHAGTLIELPAAGGEAPELAAALKRPGAGTAAKDVVDAVSEATGRIEKAAARFEAVADGSIDISEASDVIDGVIGLLEQLDRERHHQEALNVARAVNGLLALAMRWAELARSLGIAVDVARRFGARAAEGSAEQIGARAGEAWAQHELGTLHLAAGDQVAADRLLSEAQRLRRELGDREGLTATEHNLGVLCRRVAGDGRLVRRSRRLLVAAAALLLLLAGGVGGAVIASRDDEELIGAVAHLTVQGRRTRALGAASARMTMARAR